MAEKRRYCGRVGIVVVLADGEKCPECGYDKHKPMPDDECGNFVPCPRLPDNHGHPCLLPRPGLRCQP